MQGSYAAQVFDLSLFRQPHLLQTSVAADEPAATTRLIEARLRDQMGLSQSPQAQMVPNHAYSLGQFKMS